MAAILERLRFTQDDAYIRVIDPRHTPEALSARLDELEAELDRRRGKIADIENTLPRQEKP